MPYKTITVDDILLHFPLQARAGIRTIFDQYRFRLRITAPRQTRLGSFRHRRDGEVPVIQVNGDLKPYTFLLIFLHETAHLIVWLNYGRKVAAHGPEWKAAFKELAAPYLDNGSFPDDIRLQLIAYFRKTSATFHRNTLLLNALARHEGTAVTATVADIPINETFRLANGKQFVKIQKLRTRYKCYCSADRKYYLVHGSAQVLE